MSDKAYKQISRKDYSDIQRAIGIIEGVSFCLDQEKAGALVTAVEILDEALREDDCADETE